MKHSIKLLTAASIFSLVALGAAPAFAAPGTQVGQTISNTVTVNFRVGGVDQTASTATDNVAVDRKVNLTVTEVGTVTTPVSPGQVNTVTTFQVTNLTNDIVDLNLTAAQLTGGSAPHGGTDNFNATNIRIYKDDGDGIFNAADTLVTYLDEVAAEGAIGSQITVFVVADIPISRVTGDIAAVSLTATAYSGGTANSIGSVYTNTVGANTAGVDTVLADGAGSDDAIGDGKFSARDDYTVSAAALSAIKSSRIISDPVNGVSANAKAIPGAVLEYCIAVSNAAGSATATNVAISDPLPLQTTFVAGSILINGTYNSGTSTCNADGVAGGSFGSNTVSATLSNLPAGSNRTVVFRATVN